MIKIFTDGIRNLRKWIGNSYVVELINNYKAFVVQQHLAKYCIHGKHQNLGSLTDHLWMQKVAIVLCVVYFSLQTRTSYVEEFSCMRVFVELTMSVEAVVHSGGSVWI